MFRVPEELGEDRSAPLSRALRRSTPSLEFNGAQTFLHQHVQLSCSRQHVGAASTRWTSRLAGCRLHSRGRGTSDVQEHSPYVSYSTTKSRKCLYQYALSGLRFVPPWPSGGHRTFDSNTLTLGIISPIVLLVPPADNGIYYGRWRARKRTFDCLGLCYLRFWTRKCVMVDLNPKVSSVVG